ncbi:hypothetical protein B0H17DRAFT_1147331 [Mycena rosella]|uniref:Uncharacterized protein n=1 Tax=Mycena rosella TaxID=1033263 RepID=A0AAD7CLY8_MYCRO|nr:hypothetical protein B0H17DRAFT_1147331 [Mycena rosella]
MNRYNDSGFGWAYVDPTGWTIVWKEGEAIADAKSFGVLKHETLSTYLAPGNVPVTQAYFDNTECLAEQEQTRNVKYYNQRLGKRKRGDDTVEPGSQEALEAFACRCQELLKAVAITDAAATADATTANAAGTAAARKEC